MALDFFWLKRYVSGDIKQLDELGLEQDLWGAQWTRFGYEKVVENEKWNVSAPEQQNDLVILWQIQQIQYQILVFSKNPNTIIVIHTSAMKSELQDMSRAYKNI